MNHRHALWLAGPLLLALAAQLLVHARDRAGGPGSAPTSCGRWVQVGGPVAPLLCLDRRPATRLRRAGVSRACLRRHPPRRLRAGDRLQNVGTATCQRRRMTAAAIVTLGLPVDVNRAGIAELATLPGVGPGLARRIRNHRRRNGPFRRPADLLEVRGIGRRLLSRIRSRLTKMRYGGPETKTR